MSDHGSTSRHHAKAASILGWLADYRAAWLPYDIVAGVTLAAYAIPVSLAYAALAGCAGVYAKKACRELGLDDTGIWISLRVVAKAGQPLVPARFATTVAFPDRFDNEQQAAVLRSIEKCAVKAIIQAGAAIEFTAQSAQPPRA